MIGALLLVVVLAGQRMGLSRRSGAVLLALYPLFVGSVVLW